MISAQDRGLSAQDRGKRAAAIAAVTEISDGMKLGLGTGSTVDFALVALAQRIRDENLRVCGVATSIRTQNRAQELGIPVVGFDSVARLDLAIDGADEVLPGSLALIKGAGGALMREKIVAAAAARFVVIADASKLVIALGQKFAVPVEVSRFGHEAVAARLAALGGKPVLRLAAGAPVLTDGGNLIYDCAGFAPIRDPETLARQLAVLPGVLEHGLFLHMAQRALIADAAGGVQVLDVTCP